MAFGAGVLISAVAFDLVEEASEKSAGSGWAAVGLFAGYLVFFFGDRLIDRFGGSKRKDASGNQEGGSPLAIVLGTVLDGIPESMVISTSGLTADGWARSRIMWMWIVIAVVAGLASLAGYALFQDSSPDTVAFVLSFAAGAIITMLASTMMPEAFEHGGKWVGVVTTLGFAVAFTIHVLDGGGGP